MIIINRERFYIVLLLLIGILSFVGLFGRDLWTPDEPREAAISLEMAKEKSFLLPKLAAEPFVEKPPLFYMFGAITILMLGNTIGTTSALKLIPLVSALITLLLTFHIAKLFFEKEKAFNATLILPVLPGFLHITHWLIIDNLLMMLVALSIYFLAKSYIKQKWFLLPAAAVATGLAFWTKGMIALVFIFLGWVGIVIGYFLNNGRKSILCANIILWHLCAFVLMVLIIAIWPVLLFKFYGKELFDEWFWQNNFGRFAGTSTNLGHINKNPFYYLGVLLIYLFPFLMHFFVGLKILLKQGVKRFSLFEWFIVMWGIAGLLVLSISSTKREIYLAPLLPAYAFLIYLPIKDGENYLCSLWEKVVMWLLVFVMISLPFGIWLAGGRFWNIVAALLALLIYFLVDFQLRKKISQLEYLSYLTRWLVALICFLVVVVPMVDKYKSYREAFIRFSNVIEKNKDKCVLWKPDETTRAGLYYYAGISLPTIYDKDSLKSVLSNNSNFVIALNRSFPPKEETELPEWTLVYEENFGYKKHPRRLMLVKGERQSNIK